jgi:3-oxoacyl-[acyl-carrier-protein] synthase II
MCYASFIMFSPIRLLPCDCWGAIRARTGRSISSSVLGTERACTLKKACGKAKRRPTVKACSPTSSSWASSCLAPQSRGAKILGVIAGYGEVADTFHRTRPKPDGIPIADCLRNALADAGMTFDQIDYINAHGTSTPENDKMEYLGAAAVFGDHARKILMAPREK